MEEGRAERVSLLALFWTFLKIGSTAWGGFMALITVVRHSVVERRGWLREEEMLDGISLATLLPGPVAVNVVAYVGYQLRGGMGALVSTVAVILPSFLLVLGLTMAYFQWGQIPAVNKAFAGFIPAVTAVILAAAWGMRGKALKGALDYVVAIVAAVALLLVGGFYLTLGLIFGAGVVGWVAYRDRTEAAPAAVAGSSRGRWLWALVVVLLVAMAVSFVVPIPGVENQPLAHLFNVFSGMSLMLFGGGFVFIPLIQETVVDGLAWVTQLEFTSAIAMGQVTPGPILISAAFIGYKVWGVLGALIATIGIFLPPALLMLAASRVLERIKASAAIQAALRGVRAAVLGLIVSAAVVIAQTAEMQWPSALIFVAAALALLRFKVDVVWVIPSAGLLGVLLY